MKQLDATLEDVRDMIKWDKVIDQGGRTPYDLSPEQEREAKKFANVKEHKRPANYKFSQRQHKENPIKADLIQYLFEKLTEYGICTNVNITNKERMIAFEVENSKFELTLVQKRAPKS